VYRDGIKVGTYYCLIFKKLCGIGEDEIFEPMTEHSTKREACELTIRSGIGLPFLCMKKRRLEIFV
jgi:hypothetical protein